MFGVVLLCGAVYSVYVDWQPEITVKPSPVCPLRTILIESTFASDGRKYPGRVAATQSVDLKFDVSGTFVEFDVKQGQRVETGETLAKLDRRDFEAATA